VFGSICQHCTFLPNMCSQFVVKQHGCSILGPTQNAMSKISREDRILIQALLVEKNSTSRHFLAEFVRKKLVEIEPRSTHEKSGCWINKWQNYWSRSSQVVENYPTSYVAPPVYKAFVDIKLSAWHLLHYEDCMCQKLQHLVNGFIKQKCNVAPFILAHPVFISKQARVGG